jgi:hypothetical protein
VYCGRSELLLWPWPPAMVIKRGGHGYELFFVRTPAGFGSCDAF